MIVIANVHPHLEVAKRRPLSLGSAAALYADERRPLLGSPPPYVSSQTPYNAINDVRAVEAARIKTRRGFLASALMSCLIATMSWLLVKWQLDALSKPKTPSESPADLGEVVTCSMQWFLAATNGENPHWPEGIPRGKPGQEPPRPQPEIHIIHENGLRAEDDFPQPLPYYAAIQAFDLPPAHSLHLYASGDRGSGVVHIVSEETEGEEDEPIKIDVVARYWSLPALLNGCSCVYKRGEGAYGYGLETSKQGTRDMIWYNITVTIPYSKGCVANMGSLKTDMSFFGHKINLSDHVVFNSTHLSAPNAVIQIESLRAKNLGISTTNSPISGSVFVETSARIATTNSPLDIEITTGDSDWHTPTVIELRNENNILNSQILSTSKAEDPEDAPGIEVDASTFNGPLTVEVQKAPFGTRYNISGSTTNADAKILVPYEFTGTMQLTSNRNFHTRAPVGSDPRGRGYRRNFDSRALPNGDYRFQTWWASRRELQWGYVHATSHNGDAIAMVTGAPRN